MSSCFQGSVSCRLEDGTARTEQAKLFLEVFRNPGPNAFVRCETNTVTCLPEVAFAFHGSVLPSRTEIRTRCQWKADDKGFLDLQRLRYRDVGDLEQLKDLPQVGRPFRNMRDACPNFYEIIRSSLTDMAWQAVPDLARTCLPLGRNAAAGADFSGCTKPSETAICEYGPDTIAGGCDSAACVRDGVKAFVDTAKAVVEASDLEGAQRGTQDVVLASLVQSLRDRPGACGQEGKSCLARLDGDCEKLAEYASDFQALGRPALYRAFKAANETCVSEAGLRDRPG